MMVANGRSVFAQRPGAGRIVRTVGHQRAGFAAGAEIFPGVEAITGEFAERADHFAAVAYTVSLGGVLDQREAMAAADFEDGIDVEGMPVEMNRHDRLGPRGNRAFEESRIQVHGGFVDLDEDRLRADISECPTRGDEGEWCGDDLVAGTEI